MEISKFLSYLLSGTADSSYVKSLIVVVGLIFLFPFVVTFLFECIFSIKSGVDYGKNRLFGKYMPNFGIQGEKLRNISINKEYIIITEDFFKGIYSHKKLYSEALSDAKLEWLFKKELDYNIIIVARCGDYSTKFANLISFCVYYNLPICRIIDSKPGRLKEYKEKLSDGEEIIYYLRNKSNE